MEHNKDQSGAVASEKPQFPWNPDPINHEWTQPEIAAIHAFGEGCFQAGVSSVQSGAAVRGEVVAKARNDATLFGTGAYRLHADGRSEHIPASELFVVRENVMASESAAQLQLTDAKIIDWAEGYLFSQKGFPHKLCFSRTNFINAVRTIIRHSPAHRAADAPSEPSGPASMTDVDRMRMPKRDAFIKWAKGRALDVTESKDAWGNRSFVHPHIESIWFGWFHAPSEPACKLCNDTGDMSLGPTDNFGQCSCRAADALDSQPTDGGVRNG